MTVKNVPIANLVEDYALYPRHAVDSAYVNQLAQAIEAGEGLNLPHPVVDAATLRIIDGFHRVRAWRKVIGPSGSIPVDMRSYPDLAAMIEDAVKLNAAHGRKLDSQDRTRSALMLSEVGYDVPRIAAVLHTTEAQVIRLQAKVVVVDGKPLPAKPVVWSEPGEPPRVLTADQYEVVRSSSGYRTAQTVTQLTRELNTGIIDVTDENLAGKLRALRDAIDRALETVGV